MAVASGDIKFRLSVNTSPGNSAAQPDPNAALGGFMSTTDLVDNTLHNLFDQVGSAESSAGDVEYRCLFILNGHATDVLQNAVVWIPSETAGGASIAIGLDPAGVVAGNSATAQAATIADENTAPSGVTFSTPTTEGAALSIGTLNAGQCRGLWIRRTVPAATGAQANDGATIRVKGDTV